eukprot:CAMPEP_0170133276 /NCGR_PEP_ID=MMETSP0033_2-20121228/1188_1 /TAXON_ID=195969 /ORGANISM="Dolichomastix tenuilepis, Strain CCMP3274" /LENGTH=32 /DNA_ID= /DNA_START= /DNA_END= /DNA_ORIENTATION=
MMTVTMARTPATGASSAMSPNDAGSPENIGND